MGARWWLLLAGWWLAAPAEAEWCPSACECLGPESAAQADCSNRSLSAVPTDLSPGTVKLYLSDNHLTQLEDFLFQNLSHLFELNLAHNNIVSVSPEAFSGLSKLRSLSLQNNKLKDVPVASFQNIPSLEALHLDNNQLSKVPPGSFGPLRRLQKLWINGNLLREVPSDALSQLPELEALDLGENRITSIPNFAFEKLTKLAILMLYRNEISYIAPHGLDGLESLKVLEIHGNKLTELPVAISSLPTLRELVFSDNAIPELPESAFRRTPKLTLLEMGGNPILRVGPATFANLPSLKKLRVSEARQMETFPDLSGTNALELLALDRANIKKIPDDLCGTLPHLRRLILSSNQIESIPDLQGCKELRQIDLSYNKISSLSGSLFLHQSKLVDLSLSYNSIKSIPEDAFRGLLGLQVLDLLHNSIEFIHEMAFANLTNLVDLNLGENRFPSLPTEGLQNVRQLKTHNNRRLREFPAPAAFPKAHSLALSYAYHCCEFRPLARRPPLPGRLQETIVWLAREDVDMDAWSGNVTDVWPGYENFSSKFEEFAGQLWKSFSRDHSIPDNLAQFAEEHFRDHRVSRGPDATLDGQHKQPVQCLPEPGPFMPCEDLFGWWSLRCGVWVVFLLAVLGNGVVVVVLLFGRSKVDVPRFLVANLAVADFFMGLYLGILAVVDASTLGEFRVYAIQWQMSAGCQLAGFLGVLSSELSVYTLAVITLERNYAITHAMHLNKRLSLRHAAYIMAGGWLFALLMAILPLLGISDYRKFAVCLPFEAGDPASLAYLLALILVNGLAFLTLMGCYLKMYWVIRGSQAWNSNDSRIAKRMALLVVTDFACWAPIAFCSLAALGGLDLVSLEEAKVFTIFVLPLNSCANPFLYAISTKQFKKDCVLICKRIEESRVTRGIGRCRHSSNFSNRHTPANTNSAGERKSGPHRPLEPHQLCQCGAQIKPQKQYKAQERRPEPGWKSLARRYLTLEFVRHPESATRPRDDKAASRHPPRTRPEPLQKRTSSVSSDNFSSRSDSWRQGNFPLRLLERGAARRNSWTGSTQKSSSQDSNSCSRQDSGSTTTSRLSRSSVSSDASSSRPGSSVRERAALVTSAGHRRSVNGELPTRFARGVTLANLPGHKPRLCRQGAVVEESSFRQQYRGGPTETAILRRAAPLLPPAPTHHKKGVCSTCGRRETLPSLRFKSKELEDKFNCFYNRLVETSHEESSEANNSRDDHALSTEDAKTDSGKETVDTSLSEQASEDLDSSTARSPTDTHFPQLTLRTDATRSADTSPRPGSSSSTLRVRDHRPYPQHPSSSEQLAGKSRSMSSLGLDLRLFSRQRKAVSDNSLRSALLVPRFLRSLSSQAAGADDRRPVAGAGRNQLSPGGIPYCRSEATIVGRSPDDEDVDDLTVRHRAWAAGDAGSSSEADVDDDEVAALEGGERAKVLVKRKGGEGQAMPLCGTSSTASDDQPLIDREVKPAARTPQR